MITNYIMFPLLRPLLLVSLLTADCVPIVPQFESYHGEHLLYCCYDILSSKIWFAESFMCQYIAVCIAVLCSQWFGERFSPEDNPAYCASIYDKLVIFCCLASECSLDV